MNLVYYQEENKIQYCKSIVCSIDTLDEKLLNITSPIKELFLTIKKSTNEDLDTDLDTDLNFKTYFYEKKDGKFYIAQKQPSDIMVKEKTRQYINNLIEL